MIKTYFAGKWKEYDSLSQAIRLEKEKQNILSVVGGGGKTTVIRRLQQEYAEALTPSIVTTTTHIQQIDKPWFLGNPSMDKLQELLCQYKRVWMGQPVKGGKLAGFSQSFVERVIQLGHTMFIEADGAKRMPCKAPEEHEPVILPESTMILSVYGMDALGKTIEETCFRKERVVEVLKKDVTDVLTKEDIVTLALSPWGGRKSVEDDMEYQVVLNKTDTLEQLYDAMWIGEQLYAYGVARIHLTSGLMSKESHDKK